MAYKLNSSGYYVDSSGKKYDAASGWTVSKDGKTLTNSFTNKTVTDKGSTTSNTSSGAANRSEALKTGQQVASKTSSSSSSRSYGGGYNPNAKNTGSSQNQNSAVSQANAALNTTPQINWTVTDKQTPAATATPSAAYATSANGKQYTIDSPNAWNFINNQSAGATMTGGDNSTWTKNADGSVTINQNGTVYTYRPNGSSSSSYQPGDSAVEPAESTYVDPAVKALFNNVGLAKQPGVFLEMGGTDVNKSIPQTAYALDGSAYTIDSAQGLTFLHDAKPGETMVGGDGSKWTKNEDGSLTVYKNGKSYIYGASLQTGIYPEEFEYTPFDQTEAGQNLLQEYQQLMDKIQNYDAFSYDPNTDPLYLQYADSYTRGGQRAMTDILGQLAARTGGMASSYAGSIAQQTYDQYMADLASKIPELQQLAYSMYMDQYNRDVGNYERAYNQFADAYNRYGQDTQFRYNQYQDDLANRWKNLYNTQDMYQQSLSNYNSSQQWEAQMAQQDYENRMAEEQRDWERQQAELSRQDAEQERKDSLRAEIYNRVLNQGYRPTQEDAVRYGLTQAELASLQQEAVRVRASEATRYYGGW